MQELEEILESHEIPDENPSETQDGYIRRKRREFLDEMVIHFSANPRAIDPNGKYVYSHSVNGGCAIGRKVSADLANRFDCAGIETWLNLRVSDPRIFNLLPIELSILGATFLQECQGLHDISVFWSQNGLSCCGKDQLNIIIERYC